MYSKLMRNVSELVCITIFTAACATGPVDPENSPLYNIPTGTTLVLHTELIIPADKAAVFIQNGEVKSYRDIDKYYPHCKFEVRTIKQDNQTIQPDTFIIQRSTTEEVVKNTYSLFRQVSMDGGDGPAFIEMNRLMYLASEQQPDVYRLTCGIWAISPHYDQLTLSEIRRTLGKLISLHRPGTQASI